MMLYGRLWIDRWGTRYLLLIASEVSIQIHYNQLHKRILGGLMYHVLHKSPYKSYARGTMMKYINEGGRGKKYYLGSFMHTIAPPYPRYCYSTGYHQTLLRPFRWEVLAYKALGLFDGPVIQEKFRLIAQFIHLLGEAKHSGRLVHFFTMDVH